MAKYLVSFTQEQWYTVEINANSEEDAREVFWSGYWDWESARLVGEETQDGIDIEEA